jgi:hypothetical protein
VYTAELHSVSASPVFFYIAGTIIFYCLGNVIALKDTKELLCSRYKKYENILLERYSSFSIQINQPTKCKNFSSLLLDVYLQLNMFRASSRPSSGAQQLQ